MFLSRTNWPLWSAIGRQADVGGVSTTNRAFCVRTLTSTDVKPPNETQTSKWINLYSANYSYCMGSDAYSNVPPPAPVIGRISATVVVYFLSFVCNVFNNNIPVTGVKRVSEMVYIWWLVTKLVKLISDYFVSISAIFSSSLVFLCVLISR